MEEGVPGNSVASPDAPPAAEDSRLVVGCESAGLPGFPEEIAAGLHVRRGKGRTTVSLQLCTAGMKTSRQAEILSKTGL